MDSKRPFPRVAARASAGFAFGAVALFVAPQVGRFLPTALPETYGRALFSLSALGVCVCLLVSLAMGVTALCGVRKHGRPGIFAPAMIGLVLSGLMLLPILRGLNAGIAAQAREVPSPPSASTNSTRN